MAVQCSFSLSLVLFHRMKSVSVFWGRIVWFYLAYTIRTEKKERWRENQNLNVEISEKEVNLLLCMRLVALVLHFGEPHFHEQIDSHELKSAHTFQNWLYHSTIKEETVDCQIFLAPTPNNCKVRTYAKLNWRKRMGKRRRTKKIRSFNAEKKVPRRNCWYYYAYL